MYSFIDVTGVQGVQDLPAEALSINGIYIENIIPGYRTLYVAGRELAPAENDLETVGSSDGAILRNHRKTSRSLRVGYQLTAPDSETFRARFDALTASIDVVDARLIFNDENDKFYIGTYAGTEDVGPGYLSIVSEFRFDCPDPHKYSVAEYTAETTTVTEDGESTVVFNVDYDGTELSHPTLTAVMGESENDKAGNGFIGYVDQNGSMLQFGDPDEGEGSDYTKSELLKSAGFASAIDALYNNTASALVMGGYAQAGSLKIDTTNKFLTGNGFGSGNSWHGASATAVMPADSESVTGSQNFSYTCRYRFQAGSVKQYGMLQILLTSSAYLSGFTAVTSPSGDPHAQKYYELAGYDDNGSPVYTRSDDRAVDAAKTYYTSAGQTASSDRNVAGVTIWKADKSKTAKADLYVNGAIKKTVNIACTSSNGASNGTVLISKSGNKITFTLGGKVYPFVDNNVTGLLTTKNSFYFGKYKTVSGIKYLGVYSCAFTKDSVSKWEDKVNKFSPGKTLEVVTDEAIIRYDDIRHPDYGARGNDWESFGLSPGTNAIKCVWSEWALNAPTFSMKYRKVYK